MTWEDISDKAKHNGRTTRMLREARALASAGRAVYVVAASEMHAEQIREMLGDPRIHVEHPGSGCSSLDWMTMRLRGAHPNCVVLADHWAIESRFGAALEMLHRYDGKGD